MSQKNGTISFQAKVRRKGVPTQTRSFCDKRDAERWVRAAETALDRGELPEPIKLQPGGLNTLTDVLRRYASEISPKKRGGDTEVLTISRRLRACREFISTPLAQLDPAKVATWRDGQMEGRAGSSVARQTNLLLAAVNLARAEWGCGDVPELRVKRPASPPHRDRVLTPSEEKLLANAKAIKPVIEFALATAMRQGEIAALEWRDVDFERKIARLHTSKNGLPRDVPLSKRALAALDGLEQSKGPVFGMSAEAIKRSFGRLVRKMAIGNFHFHDLRHTAITHYARAGLNPIQPSVISGHKDIRMLQRYTHLKADELVSVMG